MRLNQFKRSLVHLLAVAENGVNVRSGGICPFVSLLDIYVSAAQEVRPPAAAVLHRPVKDDLAAGLMAGGVGAVEADAATARRRARVARAVEVVELAVAAPDQAGA